MHDEHKILKLSKAQLRALELMPLTDFARTLQGVRMDVLLRLKFAGLARYSIRGRPPHWKITPEGKAAMKNAT